MLNQVYLLGHLKSPQFNTGLPRKASPYSQVNSAPQQNLRLSQRFNSQINDCNVGPAVSSEPVLPPTSSQSVYLQYLKVSQDQDEHPIGILHQLASHNRKWDNNKIFEYRAVP